MNIQLDQEMMSAVVSEAILKSLDESKRNVLIVEAIKYLLTPDSRYGSSTTPLQQIFRDGIRSVAYQLLKTEFEQNGEIKTKVHGLLAEALVRLTETHREQTVENLAKAIEKGLAYKEY